VVKGEIKNGKSDVRLRCSTNTPLSSLFIEDLWPFTEVLRKNILEMAASLMACGLDLEKCLLFQQSRVHQHSELAWILGCNCSVPTLLRLSQYKEKSEKLKVNQVLYNKLLWNWVQCNIVLCYKVLCNKLQCDQVLCNKIQCN